MAILVTGGLGYIGSHTVVELLENGREVVILDNLSNSRIEVLDAIEKITNKRPKFYQIDYLDKEKLLIHSFINLVNLLLSSHSLFNNFSLSK